MAAMLDDLAVPLNDHTDKEASLDNEQRIAQGLLSPSSDETDEAEDREVVKSLLGSRGGATSDDATQDETQVSPPPHVLSHRAPTTQSHPSQLSLTPLPPSPLVSGSAGLVRVPSWAGRALLLLLFF